MGNVPHGRETLQPPIARHPHRAAEYVIDPDQRMVIVKFGKRLAVADVGRYATLLKANPLFQPSFSEIADLSEVEELDLEAEGFLKLADEIDPFSREARRAFVARTSVQKHAARMHKILRTQRNIEIFDSLEKAKRWITS